MTPDLLQKKPVIFLVGPTASGKSDISIRLAGRLKAEIVSADSMLVYKGMNIGTAKPSVNERMKIRHHLIDIVSPRVSFSVYQYRKNALSVIRDILNRGRIPLIVGGSGLYLEALQKGLSAQPKTNPKFRKKLDQEIKQKGLEWFYELLKKIDPKRAAKIHPHDRKRIIRALEIIHFSGDTASETYASREGLAGMGFNVKIWGIRRYREDLYERINRRVGAMFRNGFILEVKRLKKNGFSKTAREALGYREILEYLKQCRGGVSPPKNVERGDLAPTTLIELIQKRTRQFAKRQLTWFRRAPEIRWIDWQQSETASQVCDKIIKEIDEWLETELF